MLCLIVSWHQFLTIGSSGLIPLFDGFSSCSITSFFALAWSNLLLNMLPPAFNFIMVALRRTSSFAVINFPSKNKDHFDVFSRRMLCLPVSISFGFRGPHRCCAELRLGHKNIFEKYLPPHPHHWSWLVPKPPSKNPHPNMWLYLFDSLLVLYRARKENQPLIIENLHVL